MCRTSYRRCAVSPAASKGGEGMTHRLGQLLELGVGEAGEGDASGLGSGYGGWR